MAEELIDNIVDGENIEEIDVVDELVTSYRQYAMYVLLSRAFPRIEDGLKPVHRRILYAMYSEGYTHTKPTVKAAKPVATTMGNYHPHGDSSIYDALVGISQPWKMNVPYIITQGNWGSPTTTDGAAAMRYTECTLDMAGEELLVDIQYDTVDMLETYDQGDTEPEVLPGMLPALMVNGSSGIGVGFSCSFLPHNLTEVCNAIKFYINNPDMDVDDLLKIVPGPDFPTGAQIIDTGQIRKAYDSGRGNLYVRAKYTVEAETARKKAIVFTELPYGVVLENVVALIKEKKDEGTHFADVSSATDQSDENPRLVVSLKPSANPDKVVAELFANTPLQSTLSVNNIGIADYRATQLSMITMIEGYIKHRKNVLNRKYRFLLKKAIARLHIVDGLIKAFDILDELIDTIRKSSSGAAAKKAIVTKFSFADDQADAILAMRLSSLANLELNQLRDEKNSLNDSITQYNKILSSEAEVLKLISQDQDYLIKSYGRPRRTEILGKEAAQKAVAGQEAQAVANAPAAPVTSTTVDFPVLNLSLTATGLLNITNEQTGEATLGISHTTVENGKAVRAITSNGKHYLLDTAHIAGSGYPAEDYIEGFSAEDKPIIALIGDLEANVLLVTRKGMVKKIAPDAYAKRQGLPAIALADGDEVIAAFVVSEDETVLLVASNGKALRIELTKIAPKGRTSIGVAGMKLTEADVILAANTVTDNTVVATITSAHNHKAVSASEIPVKGRATGGVALHAMRKGEVGLQASAIADSALYASTDDGSEHETMPEVTPKTQAGKPLAEKFSVITASA